MSLISLLMTNYNCSKYIKEAIESVLKQISSEWELIIVDDDSTDNSLEIIEPYLDDERISLIKHTKNQGYAASLKTAVENSSADIIGIIDADDVLHKDAIKIMNEAYQYNTDCGLIYSTHFECDHNLKIKNVAEWVGEIKGGITNLHGPKISHFKVFKKSAYDKTAGFNPKLKKAVDKDIIYKLEEVTNLKFIDRPLYYYRMHEKGISQASQEISAFFYDAYSRCKAYNRRLNTDIPNLNTTEIAILLLRMAKYYFWQNQSKYAISHLIKAFKLYPMNVRFITAYVMKNIFRV